MNGAVLPQIGINNIWYRNDDADEVLVFVHGILSDSRQSWLGKKVYWPELIADDVRFKKIGLYLGGYHTGVDSGDFAIEQCAKQLFSYLRTKDSNGLPPVLSKKKITFVCHSMGGIVARRILCEYKDEFKNKQIGIVLIASPTYGSKWADKFHDIINRYNHKQGWQLRWGNELLKDLESRFRSIIGSKEIFLNGVEFYENQFPVKYKWFPFFKRAKIVSEESAARYFSDPKMIAGSDHFSICKPEGFQSPVHQYLLNFLEENNLLPGMTNSLDVEFEGQQQFNILSQNFAIADVAKVAIVENKYHISNVQSIFQLIDDFYAADPVKGQQALEKLLLLGDAAENALFHSPLKIPLLQVRRRWLTYVRNRVNTTSERLKQRVLDTKHDSNGDVAAILLEGVRGSEFEEGLKRELFMHLPNKEEVQRYVNPVKAANCLIALGHLGAYSPDLLEVVQNKNHIWEKLSIYVFRAIAESLSFGDIKNIAVFEKILLQSGSNSNASKSFFIYGCQLPASAIPAEEIDMASKRRAFALRKSGVVIDYILNNWTSSGTHWRIREMAAGIIATVKFERLVLPVKMWLGGETNANIRKTLFNALATINTHSAADALLECYRGSFRQEGKYALSMLGCKCSNLKLAQRELEELLSRDGEEFIPAVVSLARMGVKHKNVDVWLQSNHSPVRANTALAIGYLKDVTYTERLRVQLREAATPLEKICITITLLMLGEQCSEKLLHEALVSAGSEPLMRLDIYFLEPYIKDAIWDAFSLLNKKGSDVMDAWRRELQPLS